MFNMLLNSTLGQKILHFWALWMAKLSVRDKQALSILAVVLGVAVLYWGLISPIVTAQAKAQDKLIAAQAKWQWLNDQIPVWEKRGEAPLSLQLSSQSALMQYLQEQLKQQNLFNVMEKILPQQKSVEVSFKSVNAPRAYRWLSQMEKAGLVAKSLQIQAVSEGIVDLKVSFEVKS